jgi:hypothetical protein
MTEAETERVDPTVQDCAPDHQRFELLVNAVTEYAVYVLDPHGRIVT